MVHTSTGQTRDTCRVRFHIEMQDAIRKTKKTKGGFGGGGITTREEFVNSCRTAQKMADLSRGRW